MTLRVVVVEVRSSGGSASHFVVRAQSRGMEITLLDRGNAGLPASAKNLSDTSFGLIMLR